MSGAARRLGSAGLVVVFALLLGAAGQASAAGPRRPVVHPLLSTNPDAVAAGKRRAELGAALSSPLAPFTAATAPKAAVSGSLNQPGLSATDNATRNDGSPPDPTGAVGPDHYVEFVNSVVQVYSKSSLSPVGSSAQLDTFVGATNDAVFDPQIQWDPQGNRWFYLADDCTDPSCATTNNLVYGFSKTADPTDLVNGWCRYSVRIDNKGGVGLFDDYPKLGHNDTHLIFGTNVFDLAGDFVSARVWTVPKPSSAPIGGACPGAAAPHYWSGPASAPVKDSTVLLADPLEAQDGSVVGTPVPADTADANANGYVVAAHDPPAGTKIMAWHVDGSGNLVADGDIAVSAFDVPAPVPQPGTTDTLDSSDTRLTQAVAHADPDAGGAEAVWTQHTINGPGGRSVDRWYELLPASKTRRQEGNVSDPSSFVFNGAVSPTMSGNEAVIQYNVGGSSQLAQIWASSHKSAQPSGVMASPVKLADSTHFDQDFTCRSNDPTSPSCRWGDYAGATPDPAAATGQPDGPEHRVWGTNQIIGNPRSGDPAAPHWLTRNFALFPDRVAPTASFSASPATATRTSTVTLDGSASRDAELPGGIASYTWDFDGDGVPDQTTTTPTVTHTYPALGTFAAKLVVTDSDDGLASAPAAQTVTVQNLAPTAKIVAPLSATQGKAATFFGSGSSDPDGAIVAFKWDLDGNGSFETSTGSASSVKRTFKNTGTRRVGLQVTDSDGATSVTTATVKVVPPRLKLVLTPPKSLKLKSLLARGVRGKAKCGRTCVVKLKGTLARKVAKKLGTKTTIALGTVRISGTGKKAFKLVLTKKARNALKRANPKTVALTVSGTATAGKSRSRAKRTVKIKR